MKNLVKFALAYQAKGLSVLPVVNKRPLVKFADKPPLNSDEIKQMWRRYPTAAIALKTENFFVIDIDKHENGADGFGILNQLPKEWFPETLSQSTKHGGKQLFYLKRSDMKIRQMIGWQPGIDVKAHPNNYIVVAPSDGYHWDNHNAIITAPLSLVEAINRSSLTRGRPSQIDDNINSVRQRTATTEVFETIADGLGGQGQRNKRLAALSGALLFRCVKPKLAYKLVCMANENSVDPLPQDEIDRTFESILKRELRNGGGQ